MLAGVINSLSPKGKIMNVLENLTLADLVGTADDHLLSARLERMFPKVEAPNLSKSPRSLPMTTAKRDIPLPIAALRRAA